MNARASWIAPAVLLAIAIAGCAVMPAENRSLEQTRGLFKTAHADPQLARLAPQELARAEDTLHLAESAWGTLDDVAVVDHLAYLARQRLAVAREVARKAAADSAAAAARAEHDTTSALLAEQPRKARLER